MANISTSLVSHGEALSKMSLTYLTESVTATLDFELANYSQLDGMGVGKFVSSSTLGVGGYSWTIRFYPDGWNEVECAGSVSAYLYCASNSNVKIKFALNILEKDHKLQLSTYGLADCYISSPSYDWGYHKFFNKSKLKSLSNRGVNLVIRCLLTVAKKPNTEVHPLANLQYHLRLMWKDEQGADVTFSVCGQLFNAHRCLLAARSPVFKAELFGSMKEKVTQCINIDDIEPQIFEALLHFVYTDSMPDDECHKEGKAAKLQHLLVAADRYGVEKLRVMCEGMLCESIDVETVATTLVLAEQHHCKVVQEACLEFIASPKVLRAVLATDGFKHLVTSSPLLMKEILEKVSCSDRCPKISRGWAADDKAIHALYTAE